MNGRMRGVAGDFLAAWAFLTRLPAPGLAGTDMAAAMCFFPAVGAVVGGVGAGVLLAAAGLVPMTVAVLLSMAATAALTGALHEDGLADTFDGLGAADRERALEIMRDGRIGSYGALALGLVLALKATALAAMPAGTAAAAALVAGQAGSRLSAVLVVATSQYVRPAGTAGFTTAGVGRPGLVVAVTTGVLCLFVVALAAGSGPALAGAAGLVAGHLFARALFERRLGGYTGDCLGATQQISEVALYLGVVAWL